MENESMDGNNLMAVLAKKEEEKQRLQQLHHREMFDLNKEYERKLRKVNQDVELSNHYSQELESSYREINDQNRVLRMQIEELSNQNNQYLNEKARIVEENEEIRNYFKSSMQRLQDMEEVIRKNETEKNEYIVTLENTLKNERLKTRGYVEQITQLLMVIQDINLFREKKEDFKRLQVSDMLGDIFQRRDEIGELIDDAKQVVIKNNKPTFRKRRLLEMNALNKLMQKFQMFFKNVEMYNETMALRLKLRDSYSKNHDLSMNLKRIQSQLMKTQIELSKYTNAEVMEKKKKVRIKRNDPSTLFENFSEFRDSIMKQE